MLNPYKILAVFAAIFFATAIFAAVRNRLRTNATHRINPADALVRMGVLDDRNMEAWRRYLNQEVTSDHYHPDWAGTGPGIATPLAVRVLTTRMTEVMRAADSLEYDDLVEAGIRLGHTKEIAHAYAAEIRVMEDGGDPLPAAMLHVPNVGGLGQPAYRGANYVEAEEIAEEMKTVQHFGTEPPVDPLMSLLATGRIPFTGYRNPIRALEAGVKSFGAKIDQESFNRLATIRGDARPEQIADGFVIHGYADLERLCEIGNVVIATDPVSGLVVCHDPMEWQRQAIN